jgi:predicted transglutaminase-like cysteine proteinase
MAIVLDRRGDNHAVLLLRLSSGDVVLDSLANRITPWNRSHYTFLAKQTSSNKAEWGVLLSPQADR